MAENPVPNGVYRHFKGGLYKVFCVAEQTETGTEYVIYKALNGDGKVYARPLELFIGLVDTEKYGNVDQRKRFAFIGLDEGHVGFNESLED